MVCLILLALLKAQTDTVLYNIKDMLNKVSTYKGGLFLERFSKKTLPNQYHGLFQI